jgi:hypothetical protein
LSGGWASVLTWTVERQIYVKLSNRLARSALIPLIERLKKDVQIRSASLVLISDF